ncbi:GFA family protein [Marinomonas sp. A79]|uniref:GFA family protein n=1 Tax=Marinomonas vulgaris TaxID=2823372 RepID=A0ABS5HD08_9GAMM|nr:GFA family protein [Marinomonas vulgaris]MBR7888804.1 GFA family protein [Marinomonas vulgaris]
MNHSHAGSCQCGAVKFEVEGEFKRFVLCHCTRCRKTSGSNHCANLFAPGGSLKWLSGEEKLSFYRLEGTAFARTFCSICGSNVPTDATQTRGLIAVPAGSLDTDVELGVQAHIFMGSKANWDEHIEDVPAFDTMPS